MQHETLWNEAVAFTRSKSPASFEQWFSGELAALRRALEEGAP